MARNHPLHDRQPHPGPVELILAVQALKHLEQFLAVARVEAGAVVAHPVHVFRALGPAANVDARVLPLCAVLERIGDQVDPHLPQQRPVAVGRRQPGKLHARIGERRGQLHDDLARESAHVERRAHDRPPADLRELQQVVDQPAHPGGLGAHHAEQAAALGVENVRVVLLDHLRVAIHRAQRRAQVVRNRIAEGLELLVDRFELRGALAHPRFELFGMPLHALEEPRMRDGDGELRRHLARNGHLFGGKRGLLAAEAERPDQFAAGDHGHRHVDADPRGEQRVHFRSRRQGARLDDLRFAAFQAFEVAHQRQRVAHTGTDVRPAPARRGEPFRLPGLQVEQVDDRARRAEQLAQRLDDGGRDCLGRGPGDDRAVDLVHDPEPSGLLGQRFMRALQRRAMHPVGILAPPLQQHSDAQGDRRQREQRDQGAVDDRGAQLRVPDREGQGRGLHRDHTPAVPGGGVTVDQFFAAFLVASHGGAAASAQRLAHRRNPGKTDDALECRQSRMRHQLTRPIHDEGESLGAEIGAAQPVEERPEFRPQVQDREHGAIGRLDRHRGPVHRLDRFALAQVRRRDERRAVRGDALVPVAMREIPAVERQLVRHARLERAGSVEQAGA